MRFSGAPSNFKHLVVWRVSPTDRYEIADPAKVDAAETWVLLDRTANEFRAVFELKHERIEIGVESAGGFVPVFQPPHARFEDLFRRERGELDRGDSSPRFAESAKERPGIDELADFGFCLPSADESQLLV